jgi:hypothetical protein
MRLRSGLATGLALLLSIAAAGAVPAREMMVSDFLVKVEALKTRGMMAMFSSDVKVLKGAIEESAKTYRADVDAARAKGRTDFGCPPPKGQMKLDSDMLIADFNKIPATQRNQTSVKSAFYAMMKRRFPCKTQQLYLEFLLRNWRDAIALSR